MSDAPDIAEAWPGGLGPYEILRHSPGEASLVQGNRLVLEFRAGEGGAAEFERILDALEPLLFRDRLPRVVVTYQEGLLAGVQAEQALDLVFVEEDPHDVPPVQIRHRRVTAAPDAVAAALAEVERRAGGTR